MVFFLLQVSWQAAKSSEITVLSPDEKSTILKKLKLPHAPNVLEVMGRVSIISERFICSNPKVDRTFVWRFKTRSQDGLPSATLKIAPPHFQPSN